MKIGGDLATREGRTGFMSGASVVAATVVASYAAAAMPMMQLLLVGATAVFILTFIPVSSFIALVLVGRDLSDALAGDALAGTLNAGALLGLLVIAVAGLRVLGARRPVGVGGAAFVGLLLFGWFVVGYIGFGSDPSLHRELVRALSIVGLGLVAMNWVKSSRDLVRAADLVIFTALVPASVALWEIVVDGAGISGDLRARGTLSHPISASSLFVVALALALWRALDGKSRRSWYGAAALVFALCLFATRGLGGIAQGLVTLIAYSFLSSRGGARRLTTVLAAVSLVVIFSVSPFGERRLDEVGSTRSPTEAAQGNQTNSLDWRFANWAELIDAWREKPVLGYGLGTTTVLVQPGGNVPHSDAIRLLVEGGALGGIVFGSSALLLLGALYRRSRGRTTEASYCGIVLAIFVGILVHGLTNTITAFTATMYAAAVLVGAALAVQPLSARRAAPAHQHLEVATRS